MTESTPGKLCTACNNFQPIENFYKAGNYHQKRCKPCHNALRKTYGGYHVKKNTGFKKLSPETQQAVLNDITNKLSCRKIAAKHGIKYQSLLYWKRKGLIVL